MAKTTISISIDESTLTELDELAKKMGLSRSAVISMQLKAFNEGDTKAVLSIFSQMAKALGESKKERKKSTARKPKMA